MLSNEAEYMAALAKVEVLMDMENIDPTSPEGHEIVKLVNEIQEYEEKYYPIGDPTPEEAVAFRRDQETWRAPSRGH